MEHRNSNIWVVANAELLDAVRRRRRQPGGAGGRRASASDDERGGAGERDDEPDDEDVEDEDDEEEEDLGLPRSPCNSPTTADVLLEKGLKELPTQSHSTCSDGSLLSMGSSEMDEDSLGQHSGHSSKLSLHEKKMLQDPEPEPELELRISAAPLSHSAARHKMAVRPRRTHGAPRRKQRVHQLPATPEVLEEGVGRACSPDTKSQAHSQTSPQPPAAAAAPPVASTAAPSSAATESPLRSSSALGHHPPLATSTPTAASAGATSAPTPGGGARVTRSRSNAAARQREPAATLTPPPPPVADTLPDDPPAKENFFSRILRSSGRRKKEKDDVPDAPSATSLPAVVPPKRIDERGRYAQDTATPASSTATASAFGPRPHYRSTASARQRVEPINLPPSPESSRTAQPPPPRPAWPEPPVPAPRRTLMTGNTTNERPTASDPERACLSLLPDTAKNDTETSARAPVKKSHSFRAELSAGVRGLSLGTGEVLSSQQPAEKTVPAVIGTPTPRYFTKHAHVSTTRLGDDGNGRPRRLKHKSASLDSISSSGGGGSGGSLSSGDLPAPTLKSASIDSVDSVAATAGAVTVRVRTTSEHKSEPELPAATTATPVTVRTYAPLSLPVSADDAPTPITVAVAATASVTVPVPAPVTAPSPAPVFVSEPIATPEEIKVESKPDLILETKRQATPEPALEAARDPTPETEPESLQPKSIPSTPPPERESTPSPTATVHITTSTPAPTSPDVSVPEQPLEPPAMTVVQAPSAGPRVPLRRDSRPPPAPASEPAVPEFFKVRLNRVDSRPAVNVVLSTAAGGGLPRGRLRSADDAHAEVPSADADSRRTSLQARPAPPLVLSALPTQPSVSESEAEGKPSEDALGDVQPKVPKREEPPSKAPKSPPPPAKRPEDAAILVKVVRKGEDDRPPTAPRDILSFPKLYNNRRRDSDENAAPLESAPPTPQKRVDDAPVLIKAIRKKEEDPMKAEKEETIPLIIPRKNEDIFGKAIRRKEEEQPKDAPAVVVIAEATVSPSKKSDLESTAGRPTLTILSKKKEEEHSSIIMSKKKEEDTPAPLSPSASDRSKSIEDSPLVFSSRVLRRRDDDHQLPEQQTQTPMGRRLRLKSSEDEQAPPATAPAKRPETIIDTPALRKRSGVALVENDGPLTTRKSEVQENGIALRKKSQPQIQTSQPEDTPVGSSTPDVVLRRKSAAREVGPKREEEPELLKVFARRSLKLKDTEAEIVALTAPIATGPTTNGTSARPPGRDSDKENEGGDSPREERRGRTVSAPPPVVQPLAVATVAAGAAQTRASVASLRGAVSGGGRGVGVGAAEEPSVLVVCQKENTTPALAQVVAAATEAVAVAKGADEAATPQFKRIQQRKEEWELRAQAARKALP